MNSSHPPEDRAEAWKQAISSAVRASAAQIPHAQYGLDRARARIAKEAVRAPSVARAPSLSERIAAWFGASRMTPALGAACAIMAVQLGVIGLLVANSHPDTVNADTRSAAQTTVPTPQRYVRVTFSASTTESALRSLLIERAADIVAGPTQIGEYYLLVAPNQIDALAAGLASHPNIETVAVTNALPTVQ
jgi:hypothetical protein